MRYERKLSTAVHSYGDARFSSILRYFGRGSPRKCTHRAKRDMINQNFNNASSENNAFFNQLFKYNIKITAQNIFTRKKGVKIIMDNTRKDTCTCKTCKENKGVACDVTNCYYHDGECHCTAEKISVGPSYATSCTDTVCATFRQKNI